MVDEFKKSEAIIHKLARMYLPRLSKVTMYSLDDLISEGWEVYLNCKRFEDDIKCQFTTYLYTAIDNKFKSIVTKEVFSLKRRHEKVCLEDCQVEIRKLSPEKAVMAKQAISAISEVSYDFALMIVNGVPKDLLFVTRRHMRGKKAGTAPHQFSGTMLVPKKILEMFFNVNIDELKKLTSKYI